MREALKDSLVSHLAEKLHAANLLCPATLFADLTAHFGTDSNKAALIEAESCQLLTIKMDEETTAAEFVETYQTILLRLKACGAPLADDVRTQRTFLQAALVDPEFIPCRKEITKDTSLSIEDCLKEIREHDDLLDRVMANGGSVTDKRARRQVLPKKKTPPPTQSKGFRIPKFPPGWKTCFGIFL